MDYGFAPGRDAHLANVRGMFSRRSGTTLINIRRVSNVRRFINHLDVTPSVVKPIGDILLGSHANREGMLFLPMFPGQAGPTQFETLEDTIATATHSVSIPDALIGFNAGDPITTNVHIKGCNIGRARPFLVKFKEALGDHIIVTAPLHFHGATSARGQGIFEYMAYEFLIRRSSDFPNRAAALTAFNAAGFTLIDGSAVPTANWGAWVPARINRTRTVQVATRLGVTIGRRTTINVPRQFRVDRDRFSWTITYPNAGSVPSGNAARLSELETSIQGDARFDPTHDFPMYERLGYSDFADFFAGYTWNCQKNGRRLVCVGRRTVYTVVVAITDVATGNLIFNFYPNAGSPHAAVTTGLVETDADYFESV